MMTLNYFIEETGINSVKTKLYFLASKRNFICVCVCVCNWSMGWVSWTNYEVVEFLPWSGTATALGSAAILVWPFLPLLVPLRPLFLYVFWYYPKASTTLTLNPIFNIHQRSFFRRKIGQRKRCTWRPASINVAISRPLLPPLMVYWVWRRRLPWNC